MYCKNCGGNVFPDKTTVQGQKFDLACLLCGWRKTVDASANPLAAEILKKIK